MHKNCEWLDIDTAPKDCRILVFAEDFGWYVTQWVEHGNCFESPEFEGYTEPSYWSPLPTPKRPSKC